MSSKIRLGYFLSETASNLRYNGLMTLASIGTVTVSMLVLGAFLLFNLNLKSTINEVSSKTRVCVYLKAGAPAGEVDVLKRMVEGLDGVRKVYYVSVDEARARLKQDMSGQADLGQIVDTVPLPASLEIEMADTSKITSVTSVIKGQPAIDEIHYGEDVVTTLNLIRRIVQIGGLGAIIILCIVTAFVIANTIRLTVFARRKEIRIMQLVGATDWFIKWPFIMEGIFHGLVGSLLAVGIAAAGYTWLANNWPLTFIFPLAYDEQTLLHISIALITGGMLVGAFGSFSSVRKFLRTVLV
ncbi:MAG: permease-like cell division protein FtsX [bacterium]|nr:permease-like cell division protein FtsX [bacterium]